VTGSNTMVVCDNQRSYDVVSQVVHVCMCTYLVAQKQEPYLTHPHQMMLTMYVMEKNMQAR